MGIEVPSTIAFRSGTGAEHVAIGALYIVAESLEPIIDPIRAKRRLGSLLETLTMPTFNAQFRSYENRKMTMNV